MGDYAAAEDLHSRSLAINASLGDKMLEAQSLDTLGLIIHVRGDMSAAIATYRRVLAIQQEIGDRRGSSYTLTHLGDVLATWAILTWPRLSAGIGDLGSAARR